jgi:WD40 repeat protein
MVKDQTTDAGDITLSSPCPAELSGSVMCDDAFVQGLIMVSDGKDVSYVYTKTGKWALQVPSTVPLTVDVTNANGDQATTIGVPALASGEQRSLGTISLCSSGVANYTDITVGTTAYDASALALSADGSRLGVWGSGKLAVYDAKNGNLLSSATTNVNSINILEFSLDGSKLLASQNWYGSTMVFDVSATTAVAGASIPSIGTPHLSDDGTRVIGLSRTYLGKIMVYSAVDGSVIKTLNPASTSIASIGYIPDEDAAVYEDGSNARVWSIATDAEVRNFPITGINYYFGSSEDGHTIASSSNNSVYSCYDTKTGTKLGDLSGVISGGRDSAGGILLTQNHGFAEANVGGAVSIRVIKITDGTSTTKLLPGTMWLTAMAASRNEAYLAASQAGKVRIWKLQ